MSQIAGEVGELLSPVEVTRSLRDVQPAHYIFKIESLSLLEKEFDNYQSNAFEADGYKWRLSFYPNGNEGRDEKDHISLYLVIDDTYKLPPEWEVYASFKLFIFDHIRDKYLAIEDVGQVRRFHSMKTEWGFDQFLSRDTFKNATNGYLVHDCCVFGAEVFVIKYASKGECLSMKKELYDHIYTWKVQKISAIKKKTLYSHEFKLKEHKWKLQLYPKGDLEAKDQYLSLYLTIAQCEKLPRNWKLYAKFKLRVKDQVNSKHMEAQGCCCFCASNKTWGFPYFMLLSNLNDTSKGYIVNNTIIFEAEILILSVVKNFT